MFVEKLYLHNDVFCILEIDSSTGILLSINSKPRFCYDDVFVELITKNKSFLLLEDSFQYAAYIQLTCSVDRILNAAIGEVERVICAPCDKKGLQLWFAKLSDTVIELKVVKEKTNGKCKVVYSKLVEATVLKRWKEKLEIAKSEERYLPSSPKPKWHMETRDG